MTATTPVTEGALLKRINRKLANDHQRLRRNRSFAGGHFNELGYLYIIDMNRNSVEAMDVNLVETARDLKVMHENEVLATSGVQS